jgi:hypothetical protein
MNYYEMLLFSQNYKKNRVLAANKRFFCLVVKIFENRITFDLVGIANASTQEQLSNFKDALFLTSKKKNKTPTNWFT